MQQATNEVCWADSDDEDYVSMNEEEYRGGIEQLYDNDSASDAASDASNEDIGMNDLLFEESHAAVIPQSQLQSRGPMSNAGPLSANAPPPMAASVPRQNEKAKESSSMFGDFFNIKPAAKKGKKAKNINKHKKKQKRSVKIQKKSMNRSAFDSLSESDDDEDEDDHSAEEYMKKAQTSAKLNKRIERLQGMQSKYERRRKSQRNVIFKQKVNTNVISVDLGTLATAADNVATGDAFTCGNDSCLAIFSKHDALLKEYPEMKLDNPDDESIWVCQFCNHVNIIEIDNEEMPTKESVDYMIAPPESNNDEEEGKNDGNEDDSGEQQIVFCIDVSGSMCVTTPVDSKKGIVLKLKGNRLKDDEDALSQFIDPMDRNQWMPNQKKNVQYISRLQCVQSAVDEQISNLSKTNSKYKIGLVAFNNDVTVISDGISLKQHNVITGDKLNNMEKLREIGGKCKISKSVGESHEALSKALWDLKETGQTALGPALVVSIAMAASKRGSQVILCTDGLANIGVGALDTIAPANDDADADGEEDDDPVTKWYETLGDYAMSKGVIVNIISITDDGCKLENLGKLVEATNGNLKRINPLQLTAKFSGIIENKIIATNAQATMLLHPGLKFYSTIDNVKEVGGDADVEAAKIASVVVNDNKKKEVIKTKMATLEENKAADDDDKKDEHKIHSIDRSVQDVGNVFDGSKIFFEYVINKARKKEFNDLKQLPFQVKIAYQKTNGARMMRVISQQRKITYDRKKNRENLNMDIMAGYGNKVTTELCAKGDYESSRAWTSANMNYMNRNVNYNNKHAVLSLANYANNNVVLDHKMKQQQMSEMADSEQVMMQSSHNMNAYRSSPPPAAPQQESESGLSSMFSWMGGGSAAPVPPSASSNNQGNANKPQKKKKTKKAVMKSRQNARSDKFSNYMHHMKKSHK